MFEKTIVKDVVLFMAAIIVSLCGFWMTLGKDLVYKNDVAGLISAVTTPIDTKLDLYHEIIIQQEERITRQETKLQEVIEKNTEAINDLKIQLAVLTRLIEDLTNGHPHGSTPIEVA